MNLPRPREKDVQGGILEYLALRRPEPAVVRVNSGAVKAGGRFFRFNSAPGCSDIVVCYRGRAVALEVKRDRKAKATGKQESFLAWWRAAGGVGEVVSSVADVAAILDRIDSELEGGA